MHGSAPALPALLLALLLASGCVSTASTPATSSAPPVPSSPSTSATTAPAKPAPATPAEQRTPFALDGRTSAGACAFGPFPGQCQFAAGQGNGKELAADGTPLRVWGNLTWSGGGLNLTVALLHQENGTWAYGQGDPLASSATPPLAFDFPLAGRTGPLALGVQQGTGAPLAAGYALVFTPQPFHLDGTLAWRPH